MIAATDNKSAVQKEAWKPIPGYEGVYSVSNFGRVRRDLSRTCGKSGKILKQCDRGNGYPFVQLCMDGNRKSHNVHRLVASAFIGSCPPGHEVNHRNGDKADNRLRNLEYTDASSNQQHAYDNGLQDAAGERNGQAKLTEEDIRQIRREYTGEYGQQAALARKYGVATGTISKIINRKRWPHVA